MKTAVVRAESGRRLSGRDAGIAKILVGDGRPELRHEGRASGHAGMGIVAAPRYVLTCAHVLNTALGRPVEATEQPGEEFWVVFPLSERSERIAGKVVAWEPIDAQPVGDVAVLQLAEEIPADVGVATLHLAGERLDDHPLKVFGYRKDSDEGNHVDAKFMGTTSPTHAQIDGTSVLGVFVEGGFSGAAVWDVSLQVVVGMVVARNVDAADRVAYMVSLPAVETVWPALALADRAGRSAWTGRQAAPPVVSGVEAVIRPGGILQGNLPVDLRRIFATEDEALSRASAHEEEELEFLDRMEGFLEAELRKSGDEHFVELSMQLATPSSGPQGQFERSFSLAFGEIEKSAPVIPSLVGLVDALKEYRSLVLLGGPGSGKTTVLQHLALRMIGDYRRGHSELLPVYLPLTKYTREQPALDLVQSHVVDLVGETHFLARNFQALAKLGRVLLILDGLDQMPNRRSETIRLERLRRLESDLRRFDRVLKITKLFRQQGAVARLIQGRQAVSDQIAPTVDRREQLIERLPDLCSSPVITSCRTRDFVGSPRWQSLVVLPMDSGQVREFLQKHSPEAMEAVEKQWRAATGTRDLIGNPFYLRMLSEALKRKFTDETQQQEFRRAAAKRGKLLEFLLRLGLERELRERTDLFAEEVLERLGQLAYAMLRHNVIGAVPHDALTRWLGEETSKILKIAEDVNLLTIREGPPVSVDFNHQLFLEFLLALHLKNKRETEGGFQEGLLLLARRGDRWAETINLLFELVGDEDRGGLVTRFVDALREPTTWDIATRVLAGIGDAVAPGLADLLADEDELARRGAVKVLGKIGAVQYVQDLAALRYDRSWRVRRDAVDSLIALKQLDVIAPFTTDDQPSVVRAAFRGQLQLRDQPAAVIREVVFGDDRGRQEQMAWATHDLFAALSKRLSEVEMAGLLRDLLDHDNQEVKRLAYLMVSQASESAKRSLKKKLLAGALSDTDKFINCVARGVVSDFLAPEDIREIELRYEGLKRKPLVRPRNDEQRETMLAFSLLAEARQKRGPKDVLDSFVSAQSAEIEWLMQRLGRQGDAAATSLLVHLMGEKQTTGAAIAALVCIEGRGTAHLVTALDDPDPRVQLSAARFLNLCDLPRRHVRKVRAVLRREKVRVHVMRPFSVTPAEGSLPAFLLLALTTIVPFTMAAGFWLLTRSLGASVPYTYWLRFLVTNLRPGLVTGSGVDLWLVHEAERQAWAAATEEPSAEFWLARGTLLRLAGNLAAARKAINRSLHLSPELAPARYELALLERSGGNLEGARRTLRAEDGRFIEPGSKLEDLDLLLQLDDRRGGGDGSFEDPRQRARILVKLGLWQEALVELKALFVERRPPADGYLLLYRSYSALGESRRALAAALAHNDLGPPGTRVPPVEIENLRWLHRDENLALLTGKLDMQIDLGLLEEALVTLHDAAIVPAAGEPLAEDRVQRLRGLDSNLFARILDLLTRLGRAEEAAALKTAVEAET